MAHPVAELVSTVLDVVAAFFLAADAFGQELLQKTTNAFSALLADLDKITKSTVSSDEKLSLIVKSIETHTTPIMFAVLFFIAAMPFGLLSSWLIDYFDKFWGTWLKASGYLKDPYYSLLAKLTLTGISVLAVAPILAWTLPRPVLLLARLIVSGMMRVQSRFATRGMLALIGLFIIVINHAISVFVLK